MPPPVPPVVPEEPLGALGVTTPLLLEELELLELLGAARAGARGADRLRRTPGSRRRRRRSRPRTWRCRARSRTRSCPRRAGPRGRSSGRRRPGPPSPSGTASRFGVGRRVELLDLVDHALAELGDLVGLGHALAGRRRTARSSVFASAQIAVRLGDELGLAQRSACVSVGTAIGVSGELSPPQAESAIPAPTAAARTTRCRTRHIRPRKVARIDGEAAGYATSSSSSGCSTSFRCAFDLRCPLRPP